jgi:hypothetical protein
MNLQNLYQPPTTNTDLKNIPVRKNYLTQDELFSIIKRNSEQYSLPPDNIIKGICFFLVKKNFNLAKLDIQKILNFLQKLNIITKGIDFYK